MDKADAAEKEKDGSRKTDANTTIKSSITTTSISSEIEDEKERTIAKAALTIAELSQLLSLCYQCIGLQLTLPPITGALLDPSAEETLTESDTPGPPSTTSVPLTAINAVAAHLAYVDAARSRITADMEAMVISGLATLVRIAVVLIPLHHAPSF